MIKKIIEIIGIAVLLIDLIFVTRAFILAYLNPNHRYIMNINSIGEAFPELILVLLLLPFGLYVIIGKIKEWREKK